MISGGLIGGGEIPGTTPPAVTPPVSVGPGTTGSAPMPPAAAFDKAYGDAPAGVKLATETVTNYNNLLGNMAGSFTWAGWLNVGSQVAGFAKDLMSFFTAEKYFDTQRSIIRGQLNTAEAIADKQEQFGEKLLEAQESKDLRHNGPDGSTERLKRIDADKEYRIAEMHEKAKTEREAMNTVDRAFSGRSDYPYGYPVG